MKKRLLSIMLIFTMCIAMSSSAFAIVDSGSEQRIAVRNAAVMEKVTGTENLVDELKEEKSTYSISGKSVDVKIPKSGGNSIILSDNVNDVISMELPGEVSSSKGMLTDNGTIVYTSKVEAVNVGVQFIQEHSGGIVFETLRTMVTIESPDAPKEYSFRYNLPAGYQIVTDRDYSEKYATGEEKEFYYDNGFCGEVYILNENNVIIETIDPAWAKDADGNAVKTHYKINGNELVQIIEFNDQTVFPVVADPTAHPTKTSKVYLTKTQVKDMAQMYTDKKSSTWWNVTGCISGVSSAYAEKVGKSVKITGRLAKIGYVHLAASCYLSALDLYLDAKASKLESFANSMKSSQYLRGINYQIWRNGGKNSGYYHKEGSYKIVNKKDA